MDFATGIGRKYHYRRVQVLTLIRQIPYRPDIDSKQERIGGFKTSTSDYLVIEIRQQRLVLPDFV